MHWDTLAGIPVDNQACCATSAVGGWAGRGQLHRCTPLSGASCVGCMTSSCTAARTAWEKGGRGRDRERERGRGRRSGEGDREGEEDGEGEKEGEGTRMRGMSF